eukprot:scaffold266118_cov36-Tisochrysis_lutea.AAC.3
MSLSQCLGGWPGGGCCCVREKLAQYIPLPMAPMPVMDENESSRRDSWAIVDGYSSEICKVVRERSYLILLLE